MAAYNLPAIFFSLSVLLLMAASPSAAAAVVPPTPPSPPSPPPPPPSLPPPLVYTFNLVSIKVRGQISCPATGNFPPPISSPPISPPIIINTGVVLLNCSDVSGKFVIIGSGSSDANGNFAIGVDPVTFNIPSYPLNCRVNVLRPTPIIPIPTCSAPVIPLNTTTISINGFVINQSVTGIAGLFP